MQTLIDELYESWHNGNCQYVLDRICLGEWSKAQTALAGALLYSAMKDDERMVFLRMLGDRNNQGTTK